MELIKFTNDFSSLFDETDYKLFNPQTEFRTLPEWGSFKAMSLIALVDLNYNVQINGNDIRNCNTINDLFEIVKSRK